MLAARTRIVIHCVQGAITAPCGVPRSVGCQPLSSSNTPAFRHCSSSARTLPSTMRCSTNAISRSCGIVSSTLPTLLSPTTPPPQPRHLRSFTLLLCSWPLARGPCSRSRAEGALPIEVLARASHSARRLAGRRGRIGFTLCHVRHVTLLRTGCSPPAALHLVSPRRSSLRLQAGERSA